MNRIKRRMINVLVIVALSIIMVGCGVFSSKKKVCIPCSSTSIKVFTVDGNSILKS